MSAYPVAVDDGGADHLIAGVSLPKLSLRATSGADICLGGLDGRAVIYCYSWTGRPGLSDPPDWDNIPGAHGSTPQTEGYRDLYDQFVALGVAVFGLSLQSSSYQREMVQRLNVPFDILSDQTRKFSDAMALPMFETGGLQFLKRVTFVTFQGRIERVFYPVIVPSSDAQEVVSWLRAAKS